MNRVREAAIRSLLSELSVDAMNTQDYFDDLEPQYLTDVGLQGKVMALLSYLRLLDRQDLSSSLESFLPLQGNAFETLTYIAAHIAPEVLAQLDNPPEHAAPMKEPSEDIALTTQDPWVLIQDEYSISKRQFGKSINFVEDKYKRQIIFRDVGQAYVLAQSGFNKPAVILAGGVVEELLRLYLVAKGVKPASNNFNGYIRACEGTGLMKARLQTLTDSVRHFRNLVHLRDEAVRSDSVTPSAAKGAVSSIFTVTSAIRI